MNKTDRGYYEFDCALCRIFHLPIPDPITEALFDAARRAKIVFEDMADLFRILGDGAVRAGIAMAEMRVALRKLRGFPARDYNCRPLVACGVSRWVYGAFPGPISKG